MSDALEEIVNTNVCYEFTAAHPLGLQSLNSAGTGGGRSWVVDRAVGSDGTELVVLSGNWVEIALELEVVGDATTPFTARASLGRTTAPAGNMPDIVVRGLNADVDTRDWRVHHPGCHR